MPQNSSITYPGGAPSINSQTGALTVSALLKQPTYLAKRIVPDQRLFLSDLLFRPGTTESGAVVYNVARAEDRYPSRGDSQYVEPGAEFPMIDLAEGPDVVAVALKTGAGYIVTDEARDRNRLDVIAKGNAKVRNTIMRQDAARCMAAFDAAAPTVNSTAKWSTAKAMRTDVTKAVAQIRAAQLGYTPDTVLVNPATVSDLLLLDELVNLSPREDPNRNPLFSNELANYLGLNWAVNDFVPAGTAIVLESRTAGVNVVEKPLTINVVREGTRERDVVIASRRSVPVVDEPSSVVVIKGV